jgi:hypothetical protein
MTGLGPAELKAGGRAYFDALLDRATERNQLGWTSETMLANLLEVSFASYRVLLALMGAKNIPQPLSVPRPGLPVRRAVNWRELQRRVSHGN